MSSFEFNPMTGAFDLVGKSKKYKLIQNVDSVFLSTPEITLPKTPGVDTEIVSLNGLEIDNTNYSIVGNILTMITTQLRVGDILYINFIN